MRRKKNKNGHLKNNPTLPTTKYTSQEYKAWDTSIPMVGKKGNFFWNKNFVEWDLSRILDF